MIHSSLDSPSQPLQRLNSVVLPFHHWSPFLCAECDIIQHIKTGFSGERVKPRRPKAFCQFEIIINMINVLVALSASFEYLWVLYVSGHYKYCKSFSAGMVFIRHYLTSDSDVWRRSPRWKNSIKWQIHPFISKENLYIIMIIFSVLTH